MAAIRGGAASQAGHRPLTQAERRRRCRPLAILLLLAADARLARAFHHVGAMAPGHNHAHRHAGAALRPGAAGRGSVRTALHPFSRAFAGCRPQHAACSRYTARRRHTMLAASATMTMDDFPQVLEALSTYKAEHGDADVPLQYVVPEGTGPEDIWGMRLGRRVAQLRNERDEYVAMYPERVQMLRSVGFEWGEGQTPSVTAAAAAAAEAAPPAAAAAAPPAKVGRPARKPKVDDWEAVITGLRTYAALHGDTRVPSRFAVPAEAPWPEALHGDKLGMRVNAIRSTGRYLQGREERRAELDALGFEWKVRTSDDADEASAAGFQAVVEALQVFKSLRGHTLVPSDFVVPSTEEWPQRLWGLGLGQRCSGIRSRNMYVAGHPQRLQQLAAIGFDCDNKNQATETKFRKIFNALMMYRDLNGTLEVPQSFAVPGEAPWPEEWWGMKLGQSVASIRSTGTFIKAHPARRAMLEAEGFDFAARRAVKGTKVRRTKAQILEDSVLEAAAAAEREQRNAAAAAVNASMAAPAQVAVNGDAAAAAAAGGELPQIGGLGGAARTSRDAAGDAAQSLLDSLVASIKNDQIMSTAAKVAAGSSTIGEAAGLVKPEDPRAVMTQLLTEFSVPPLPGTEIPMAGWPQVHGVDATRRMMGVLGATAMGGDGYVSSETTAAAGRGTFLTAAASAAAGAAAAAAAASELAAGEEAGGGLFGGRAAAGGAQQGRAIPRGVNTSDMNWMTDQERLAVAMHGFDWDEFGDGFTFEQVVQALKHYQALYGELEVGEDFVVPYDYEWPRDLAEMRLGVICEQMRCGDIDARANAVRKSALDALGFPWKEEEGPDDRFLLFQYDEVLCGLFAYNMIRGDLCVDADWVVPDDDPWPMPLRGLPLGFLVNVVRLQRDVLYRHYPERYRMLDGLGFYWLDPVFEDWQDISVRGVGDGKPLPGPFGDILDGAKQLDSR